MSCGSDEESDGDASVDSLDSRVSRATYPKAVGQEALKLLDPNRRGRGRPATTGEYVGILQVREDKLRLDREADEQRLERLVTDDIQSAAEVLRDVGGVAGAPVANLVTSAEEAIEAIRKVGTVSKGLKGTMQRRLKVASALIRDVVVELSTRALSCGTDGDNNDGTAATGLEAEALRARAAQAEEEARRLREEIASLRATTALPVEDSPLRSRSPSPIMTRGRKRRRGRMEDDGDEERVGMDTRMSPLPPPSPTSPRSGETRPPAGTSEGPQRPEGMGVTGAAGLEELFLRLAVMIDAKLDGRLDELRREIFPAAKLVPIRPPLRHERESGGEQHLPPQSSPRTGKKKGKKAGGISSARSVAVAEIPLPAPRKQQRPPVTATGGRGSAPAPTKKGQGQQPQPQAPPPAPAQVYPPRETWATVTKRGARKNGEPTKASPPAPRPLPLQNVGSATVEKRRKGQQQQRPIGPAPTKGRTAAPPKARKPPRTAAVTITCEEGGYETVMREAQAKIDLGSLGITGGLRVRRTLTGALQYEIAGEGGAARADALAAGLRDAVGGRQGVKVSRPVKAAELRVLGLDVTATPEAVTEALASAGKCRGEEVKVGPLRKGPTGSSSAWAKCPLTAANIIVAAGGKVRVGWAWARVTLLDERPLQCFKCMEGGHVRAQCQSTKDRTGRCYRCGEEGHLARDCTSPQARCAVCAEAGRPSGHRVGAKSCPEARRKRRRPGVVGGKAPTDGGPGHRPSAQKERETRPPSPTPSTSVMEVERGGKESRKLVPSPSDSPEKGKKRRKENEDSGTTKAAPPAKSREEEAGSRSS